MLNTCENTKVTETDTAVAEETGWRPAHPEILEALPPDMVKELAKRRLEQLKAAGYDIGEE